MSCLFGFKILPAKTLLLLYAWHPLAAYKQSQWAQHSLWLGDIHQSKVFIFSFFFQAIKCLKNRSSLNGAQDAAESRAVFYLKKKKYWSGTDVLHLCFIKVKSRKSKCFRFHSGPALASICYPGEIGMNKVMDRGLSSKKLQEPDVCFRCFCLNADP